MSTADVFLSSPAPTRLDSYATMSSSPNLPSLDDIFSKRQNKPPLRSGSHALPVPDSVGTTFTTAASLLREVPEIDIETERITHTPPRKSKPSRARDRNALAPAEAPIVIGSSPEAKPWQKFKNKKATSKGESSSDLGAQTTKQTAKAKSKGRAETVSKHFAAKESIAKRPESGLDNSRTAHKLEDMVSNDSQRSEPALRRRHNWTPPPSNNHIVIGSESDNCELHSSIERGDRSRDVFDSLLEQYGCKDTSSSIASEQLQQADILKKRKLIELVSTRNDAEPISRETSPSKPANTKKKTRTITELATAPYRPIVEPDLDLVGPATKDSLLKYFDSDGAVKALVEHQTAVMSQKKDKAKGSKAPAKPRRKKKAGTVDNPILLSPNSAMKQSLNQDFVFGTSSQLIREESPTTLRDLQIAIQASNQVDSDPFAESDSQGLWHAGARDTDGELMKADRAELVEDLPSFRRFRGQPQQPREEFADINDILKSSEPDESAARAPLPNSHFFQSQDTCSTRPDQASGQGLIEPQPVAAAAAENPKPDFELLSDTQLRGQIASYGFKPVKKRQAMIALLDQCWTSKNPGIPMTQSNPISSSSHVAAPVSKQQASVPEPPKRRGRPRKKDSTAEATSTAKTLAPKDSGTKKPRSRQKKETPKVAEIADSDLDESLSSLSRASSPERDRIFSSPPPVDLSISEEADMSLALSPTDQQANLFKHITKAVISAPRSQDPLQPSWHEKMLLYDPIVLEDLAAWLNAGALGGTGYDGEVSPFDVKKWCESKSVICLWRQNLNGKERKRY
ncbi:hypothetical protein F5Y04DRAFT_264000 [Hypomontagnella monticulosa]|nr:hypothetical protein F5Y04DRAFT_264000 [Hypomontagnella monticulosa]